MLEEVGIRKEVYDKLVEYEKLAGKKFDEILKKLSDWKSLELKDSRDVLTEEYFFKSIKEIRIKTDWVESCLAVVIKISKRVIDALKALEGFRDVEVQRIIEKLDKKVNSLKEREALSRRHFIRESGLIDKFFSLEKVSVELKRLLREKLSGLHRLDSDIRLQWDIIKSELTFGDALGPFGQEDDLDIKESKEEKTEELD